MVKMFELALGMLGEIVSKTADKALNDAEMIKDFEVILKALHKNMTSLSGKAHDIEEAIKNAERSGRKKRKREVEGWLEEVKYFEEGVNELTSEVEWEGFFTRLMNGGKAVHLNEEIDKLIEQSRNFGMTYCSVSHPKLKRLSLSDLPSLRKVGLAAWTVPNLEEIHIERCDKIEEIFEDKGSGSICLPNLSKLYLIDMPRLKSVCKVTLICNSIYIIMIKNCEILMKKLPVHLDVPLHPLKWGVVRSIRVEQEWWKSLEWDNPKLPSLLQPFLQFCED